MKSYSIPPNFSGAKFAQRYGLDGMKGEFWVEGNLLFVLNKLSDDPPILEASDPPSPTKDAILEQRLAAIETRLNAVEARPVGVR